MFRGHRNAQLIDLGVGYTCHGAPFDQRRSVGVLGVHQAQCPVADRSDHVAIGVCRRHQRGQFLGLGKVIGGAPTARQEDRVVSG